MTKIEKFEQVLSEVTTDESKNFIRNEIELEKRRADKRKGYESKTAKENKNLMEFILNFMEEEKPYTVRELNQNVPELKEYSGNKVSALVTKLKNAGLVKRTVVKGTAYFTKSKH